MSLWNPVFFEVALLLPFFCWGVYTLYLRFHKHEELSLLFESATLLGLVPYLMVQVHFLRGWGSHFPVEYIFALIGLFAATAALYGHLVISLASHLLLDTLHPRRDDVGGEPRFGAAESHERLGDYDKALEEYLLLSKMHPHHVPLRARIGETLLLLKRPAEAVEEFEKALLRAEGPEQALTLTTRLCDVYGGELGDSGAVRTTLESFVEAYPGSAQSDVAQRRIERLDLEREELPEVALESLKAHALEEAEAEEVGESSGEDGGEPESELDLDLDTLSANPLLENTKKETEEDARDEGVAAMPEGDDLASEGGLMALEEMPIEEDEEEAEQERKGGSGLMVESMDGVDWEEKADGDEA